ncbi:MAG: hypothetical protein HOC74_21580 [Gemmatimonadetes bacterium]|jgi:hypothetical protein|nr:hypothetical protein [Gemmatimonadota bacterium]
MFIKEEKKRADSLVGAGPLYWTDRVAMRRRSRRERRRRREIAGVVAAVLAMEGRK